MNAPESKTPTPIPEESKLEITVKDQKQLSASVISSSWLKFSLLICSMSLLLSGLWLLGQDWNKHLSWISWGIVILGFCLFIMSQAIMPEKRFSERIVKKIKSLLIKFHIKGWQLLCLLMSPLLAIIAFLAAGTGPYMNNAIVAIATWILAISLIAMIGVTDGVSQKFNIDKQDLWITGFLILFAGIIRGIYLGNMPTLLSGDEASSGISAVHFIKGTTNNIFRMGWYSFPAFHNWLQSIPIRIFGQNTIALRMTSAFAGSITVGVVYLVGKSFFGRKAGLFSAIFLAVFHFHHNFSRIGLNNIWDSLWFVTVLGTLWFGWQYQQRWAFVLSGLSLGFSQYFYVTSRVLLILIPAWVLLTSLFEDHPIRKKWPDLIILLTATLVVVLPLAGFYLQNPDEFIAPMARVSILDDWLVNEVSRVEKPAWIILLNQIGSSFLGILHTPLRAWYTPGVPLLRPLPATFFLIGLGVLLTKPKDNRFLLIFLWILAICIPGGLSESVPAAQRYIAISPALAILVGLGMSYFTDQVSRLPKQIGQISKFVGLLLLILIAFSELNFYYNKYTPNSDFGGANSLVAQRLADYLKSKNEDWEVLFWGYPRMGYYSIPSLQYLVPEINGLDMNNPWNSLNNPEPSSDKLIFVFLPDHEDQILLVQVDYPGGKLSKELDHNGQTLYWLYEFPNG